MLCHRQDILMKTLMGDNGGRGDDDDDDDDHCLLPYSLIYN